MLIESFVMESNEAIAIRIARLNRQITGRVISSHNRINNIDRESLLDILNIFYAECDEDRVKNSDDRIRTFLNRYRSTVVELFTARISTLDFQVIQIIGRGRYSQVHMVREKQTGDVYAMKKIHKEKAYRRINGKVDEKDILATASSIWIPKLQYAFQDTFHLYLVMELCNGGDLASLLCRQNQPMSEGDAAFYVTEITHAIGAVHEMGFVHRNVKPENILIDRCGHVKIGDFGTCVRFSEEGYVAPAVADYVAPELLAADSSSPHLVCLQFCRQLNNAYAACDYWSLGVIAFELVTLRRPFSNSGNDTPADILTNIQKYEENEKSELPFDPLPSSPSQSWRSLVAGLLRGQPARRFTFLSTLRHPSLKHFPLHVIRDQAPPWVPNLTGIGDTTYLRAFERLSPKIDVAYYRSQTIGKQLPFIGYSYMASELEDSLSGGFNSTHDCTAINLATFKAMEKLACMRASEIASLQNKLIAAEAAAETVACEAAERARRLADEEYERLRAALQADITSLTLHNKRLERQLEVEKEERMTLQRTNQEMTESIKQRSKTELQAAQARLSELQIERDGLKEDLAKLETRVRELQLECNKASAETKITRAKDKHYNDIVLQVHELRHRWLTEFNVKPIDTLAQVRELRRQSLSGSEAVAEGTAREARARKHAEEQLARAEEQLQMLNKQLDATSEQAQKAQELLREKDCVIATTNDQLNELQTQLAQERVRSATFFAQVQTAERNVSEATVREAALEEQSERTQARLQQRLEAADSRLATTLEDNTRYVEKISTLEQLVRQLERELAALDARTCSKCVEQDSKPKDQTISGTNADEGQEALETLNDNSNEIITDNNNEIIRDNNSETESCGHTFAIGQVSLLKEQLERAEALLLARNEEIATLRQDVRTANLARWRKEKDYNDLSIDAKVTARDLKRNEERLQSALEARKSAEDKAALVHKEITSLKPQVEQLKKDVERYKEQVEKLQKSKEILQAEVDRSRNDIRKLKSELQYSEQRRLHAEHHEQEAAKERDRLREERDPLEAQRNGLIQNNKGLQEVCTLLEEQLIDLEKLVDNNELKNKQLETELSQVKSELESTRSRALEAERTAAEQTAIAQREKTEGDHARDQLKAAEDQIHVLRDRLSSREELVSELESRVSALESEVGSKDAAIDGAARRVRDLQEEAAALRTKAHANHTTALKLQAKLTAAQEEAKEAKEAQATAAAWWSTREMKADATMRQQAKLIDFLQAKVEESGVKKCSLGNKLFGRSGRRTAASPPLLRVNRDLRGEVERLRTKLAAVNSTVARFPPSPRRDRTVERNKKIDHEYFERDVTPDPECLLVLWDDGKRENLYAYCQETFLILNRNGRKLRARICPDRDLTHLPHNEANRAIGVKLEPSDGGTEGIVVCLSVDDKADWVSKLTPVFQEGFQPPTLFQTKSPPNTALYFAPSVLAIGCEDGLHSLRSRVHLQWDESSAMDDARSVQRMSFAATRVLIITDGKLAHAGRLSLGSVMRRACSLKPGAMFTRVQLNENTPPHLVKGTADITEGPCAAVACGRKVYLLEYEARNMQFKIVRSLTVDRPPDSLLIANDVLYVAGEKPLKINLPSGALESFGMSEPIISAAFKNHSPPKAILQIRKQPVEILLCYPECGVFVDENGKRTRNEDPKWSSPIYEWEFVHPFLYCVGEDRVTIIHINNETYKAPPCTCDDNAVASASTARTAVASTSTSRTAVAITSAARTSDESASASEYYQPNIIIYKVKKPALLGTAPNGLIIRCKTNDDYKIAILDGKEVFRSMGNSIDFLNTESDVQEAMSDMPPSPTSFIEEIQENVEVTTGFLADIRNRARQLREKNRNHKSPDDVITEILKTEAGLNRTLNRRKSPSLLSEFDSDSYTDSEDDVCGEMFTRQVRFQ